jgi:hypothetical protein
MHPALVDFVVTRIERLARQLVSNVIVAGSTSAALLLTQDSGANVLKSLSG